MKSQPAKIALFVIVVIGFILANTALIMGVTSSNDISLSGEFAIFGADLLLHGYLLAAFIYL